MQIIKWTDLNVEELERLLEHATEVPLSQEGCNKLKGVLRTLVYLTELLRNKETTIGRLRRMLFGASTEKMSNLFGNGAEGSNAAQAGESQASSDMAPQNTDSDKKHHGHGRNGAQAYRGALRIKVSHGSLKPGDHCPDCKKGRVYDLKDPQVLVRLVARAPIQATVYERESLRCNLCNKVFTADLPEGVGLEKYDPSVGAMIAQLR
jgi:hypothetical protein